MYIIFFLSIIFYSDNAFAYLDPGSGTFIIQAIIALFSAIVIYLAYPINFIKKIVKKIKNKLFINDNKKNEVDKNK